MPLPFFADVVFGKVSWFPELRTVLLVSALVLVVGAIKWYSMGAFNTSERQMHSKVVMITGGTSGIGASVVLELAQRGAQIVLLTHQEPSDFFLVEYIEGLRERTGNEMIYAEQVDLSSLHSIRKFATKWIDNAPPRRLDMIILCAATLTPPGKNRAVTKEGLEESWMVNYLANFHLLSILSPAIRAQPADRDVRILFATCASYIGSPIIGNGDDAMKVKEWSPAKAYARSKLAFTIFGQAFQKHLDAYKRPDGLPMNARVIFVDPGYSRTPGMRRWATRGTLWGLGLYVLLWNNAWLFLKSAEGGAQSFLYAAMDVTLGRGPGGKLIKECREMDFARVDIRDEEVAKKLWEGSEKLIERVEREEAVRRALEKKEAEAAGVGKQAEAAAADATGSGTDAKQSKSRRQKKSKK
ncbi:NAD(P)-binding protein-11 [Coleophoma crateriformis]|uniref:NAD(P)-binding protein-11 n=1 Tax=Coleophoma crateriformis TaxID=565419 RepID=A0A3D8S3V4_9HELO|nr:NAD(P)-binding protein-11 [Coleophoma crateriformis]